MKLLTDEGADRIAICIYLALDADLDTNEFREALMAGACAERLPECSIVDFALFPETLNESAAR